MPDNPAFPPSLVVELLNPVKSGLDHKILLIPGDLLDASIEDGELVCQLQQPLGPANAINRFILCCYLSAALFVHSIKVFSSKGKVSGKERVLNFSLQLLFNTLFNILFLIQRLLPDTPELLRCSCCRVHFVFLIYFHYKLRIHEEFRYIFISLTTDRLRDSLLYLNSRCLALDDGKRDAIHKEHNVGPGGLVAPGPSDFEFSGDVKGVILPVLPVDVPHGKAFRIAVYRLLLSGAERQQIINSLIRFLRTVPSDVLELLDGGLNILLAEKMLLTFVLNAVDLLKLQAQDTFQQHIADFALALSHGLLGSQIFEAEIDKLLQRGNLREVFFVKTETFHYDTSSAVFTRHSPVSSFCIRPLFCLRYAASCP